MLHASLVIRTELLRRPLRWLPPQEKGFVKLLRRRRDDRALWSVFADWLEEQGRTEDTALARHNAGQCQLTYRLRHKPSGKFLGPSYALPRLLRANLVKPVRLLAAGVEVSGWALKTYHLHDAGVPTLELELTEEPYWSGYSALPAAYLEIATLQVTTTVVAAHPLTMKEKKHAP